VYDAATRGRTDGALVRLITPILRGQENAEAAADARLQSLMAEMMPRLDAYIPD
jgi:hypothetical protein